MNDRVGTFGFIPREIETLPVPDALAPLYKTTSAWLCRLAEISANNRKHPWCTELAYSIYMTLKHTSADTYILANENHAVCYYEGLLIDPNCNVYIHSFTWQEQTGPTEWFCMNPHLQSRSTQHRLNRYYCSVATQKFILRGINI